MPDGMTVRKRASGVTTLINKGSPRQARRLKEQAEAAITPTSSTRVMQASPKRPRSFVSEADHPAYPSKSPRAYATQAEGVHHGMHNGMHEQEWHA
jgi:hypothetical protein